MFDYKLFGKALYLLALSQICLTIKMTTIVEKNTLLKAEKL